MRLFGAASASLAAAGILAFVGTADAQSTGVSGTTNSTGASGRMWGAAGWGSSVVDSSTMHSMDGNAAAQVAAARQGLLIGNGSNMSITAIGSQSIVSTTVIGDGNSTTVTASQTSTNSGTVTNNGIIAR
ncbi:MAG: hypothetical protein Q8M24_20365 [Pseudolabrys sp.]|nr:hypothetical protein [Pseudolabrys sp.]MDP2297805.1 hypothetical protein [Pseudolabrys sp.]